MNPLEFAIQMETDGEQFYTRQADLFGQTALPVIFRKLAQVEHKHADLIRERLAAKPVVLPSDLPLNSVSNVFAGQPDYKRSAFSLPDQLDAYRLAVGVEQRSIDLYTELLKTASDANDRTLLTFLLGQEKGHLALFEELTGMLNRKNDWVEAAEFGPREEY
jgi:rubrerythrin